MAAEIDEDVEAFRRRLDTVVRDAYSEQRQGVGIIEEIVEFEPFVFDIDVGEPFIVFKGPSRPSEGACCFNDINPDDPCHMYPNQTACEADGGEWAGGTCADNPCDKWACCYDDVCLMQIEVDCTGDFKLGQSCSETDICPVGACCFDTSCFEGYSQYNCETLSAGVYQGDGSTCTPDPCATGACCFEDNTCDELTETDCTDAGGTFKGVTIHCGDDPDPCTLCPMINLTCDSISASKSKCGYITDGSDPPQYWLRQDFNITNMDYNTTACGNFVDGACVDVSGVGPGGGFNSAIYTAIVLGSTTEKDYQVWDPDTCEEQAIVYKPESLYYTDCQYFNDHACMDPNYGPYECGGGTAHCGCDTSYFFCVTTYSDEYTTAILISNVEDALPAYSGEYTGGACASSRFLSTDEATYSIQRSKPKFEFIAAGFSWTLCYNEHFVPADMGSPSDTMRCLSIGPTDTEAFGPEMLEPSTNGTTTVEDITCEPA